MLVFYQNWISKPITDKIHIFEEICPEQNSHSYGHLQIDTHKYLNEHTDDLFLKQNGNFNSGHTVGKMVNEDEHCDKLNFTDSNYDRSLINVNICNEKNFRDSINDIKERSMNENSTKYEGKCDNYSFEKCKAYFNNDRKFIKILNFNAQGLLEGTHLDQILLYNEELKSDVIAISESWLNRSISNGQINIDTYKVFRSDRNHRGTIIRKGGGGVCAYIKDGLKVKCLEKSNGRTISLFDYQILEIQSKGIKFLFCNVYRRGDCADDETDEVLYRINEIGAGYEHVVICGDFNANVFDGQRYSKLDVLSNCMHLINDQCPTYIAGNFNPSQLDLMFSKNPNDVRRFCHFAAVGVSNHNAVCGIFNFFTTRRILRTYEIRNLNGVTEDEVNNFVISIDWSIFSYEGDIDEMIGSLYNILNRFLDEVCPAKTVTSRFAPVPWMNDEIKNNMKMRKIFYDWWLINRKHQAAVVIYGTYTGLNNKTKYMIRESKRGI